MVSGSVIHGDQVDYNTTILVCVISGGLGDFNTTRLCECINNCMLILHYDNTRGGYNIIILDNCKFMVTLVVEILSLRKHMLL